MKNILFALGLMVSSVAAAKVNGAEVYKNCEALGDEFCDAHIGGDHPNLKDGPWDYSYYHGRNWKDITLASLKKSNPATKANECGGTNQSPIDLKHSWKKIPAKQDNFQKWYNDLTSRTATSKDVIVDWNGHTS